MNTTEQSQSYIDNFWENQFTDDQETELVKQPDKKPETTENEETNGDVWLKILKQAFLFVPGAWLLFMGTSFIAYAFFSGWFGLFEVFLSVPWLVLYGFMVMFGMGDIKNPKHLTLPLSIIAMSLVVGVISFLIEGSAGTAFLSYYSIYLMPLVFAVPHLVRSFVDRAEEP